MSTGSLGSTSDYEIPIMRNIENRFPFPIVAVTRYLFLQTQGQTPHL